MKTQKYPKYRNTVSCVYLIRNTINGKFLIGSTDNSKERWYAHRNQLRRGVHPNQHLQRAWNKYGETVFEFEVWIVASPDKLFGIETALLTQYCGLEQCYNINKSADRPAIGRRWTDEQRIRASEVQRGRKLTEEEKEKLLHPVKLSKEELSAVRAENGRRGSVKRKGIIFHETRSQKISQSKIGKPRKLKTIKKMQQNDGGWDVRGKLSLDEKQKMQELYNSGKYSQRQLRDEFAPYLSYTYVSKFLRQGR